jgi:drug/metabolite transporter (DMT)-like permease
MVVEKVAIYMPPDMSKSPPAWQIWSALWVVYIVWGSTYLAIRIAVETLPPLLHAGVRFLVAGLLMYLWLAVRRGLSHVKVTARQIFACGLVGTSLLLGGNGVVAIAEQDVPSGLAALIIASVPLWVVVLRAMFGDRVSGGTFLGVIAGFGGVAMLAFEGGSASGGRASGVLLLILASISWAAGSYVSKKLPMPPDPFVSTAVQMTTGGLALLVASSLMGEVSEVDVEKFSLASLLAVGYLIVAGSLAAFTAYTWLLKNAPISKVSTYAYVNPVVAVFLGWIILSEEITVTILAGAAIIVAAVAGIVRHESRLERDTVRKGEASSAPAQPQPVGES